MIKLLGIDVDGTLTDGQIYLGNNGEEFKAFCVKDGMGIKIAISKGVIPVIITGRKSNIVEKRCQELGIQYLFQNVSDKLPVLKELSERLNIKESEIAFIGDDINDIECLKYCGLSACPEDAVEEVFNMVHFKCEKKGGSGCVREFIEYILQINKTKE